MVLDGRSSQDYPVNTGVPKGSILGPTFSPLYINELPNGVICNIVIHADDATHYSKCNSLSTADLLAIVSDRITRAFNRSGATRAVALDISKAFDRVWYAGLLHKLKSYGISGQIFGLISSFRSNRQLQVVLDGKHSQEYPVNARVPQSSILGPTVFLLEINDLPDDAICNIAIYVDDTTLCSMCGQASDLL